jgi:hypothetical protein
MHSTDPNVYINFDFENCLLTPEIQKGYSPNPTTGVNAFSGVGLIERAAEQAGDEFIPDRLEQFTAVNQLISLNPAGNILELVPLGINLVGTRLTPQLLELLLRGLIPDDDKYLAGHLESIEFILTDANGYQLGYIDPNGDYADLISSRNLSSIIDDMGLFNNIPNSHIWAEEYGQTSPIGLPKIEDISNQSTYCDADADALGGTGLDSWIQKITHFHIGLDNAVGNPSFTLEIFSSGPFSKGIIGNEVSSTLVYPGEICDDPPVPPPPILIPLPQPPAEPPTSGPIPLPPALRPGPLPALPQPGPDEPISVPEPSALLSLLALSSLGLIHRLQRPKKHTDT